jgi:hypothetical protein
MAFQASLAFTVTAAELFDRWTTETLEAQSAAAQAFLLLRDFGQKRAESYSQQMDALTQELLVELKQAGAALAMNHAPDGDEFSSVVRGLPAFELPPLHLRLSKPILSGMAPGIARKQLARQLQGQIGRAYEQALQTYAGMLRQWLLTAFGQLRKRFDAYAESYRAQAGRVLSGGELTVEEEQKIIQDLDALGAGELAQIKSA